MVDLPKPSFPIAGTYSPRARSGDRAALGLRLSVDAGRAPPYLRCHASPAARALEEPLVPRLDRAPVTLGWIESPLGRLVAGVTDTGVCLLEFSDPGRLDAQIRTLERRLGCAVTQGEHPLLPQLGAELAEYFAGERRTFSVPLHYPGTEFQVRVWTALRDIPYGQTTSYEALAATVSRPGAQRAVGKANGDNRIAIVIPCHRVVRKDGTLCGYGGGLWRKRRLLELERGLTTLALDDAS